MRDCWSERKTLRIPATLKDRGACSSFQIYTWTILCNRKMAISFILKKWFLVWSIHSWKRLPSHLIRRRYDIVQGQIVIETMPASEASYAGYQDFFLGKGKHWCYWGNLGKTSCLEAWIYNHKSNGRLTFWYILLFGGTTGQYLVFSRIEYSCQHLVFCKVKKY